MWSLKFRSHALPLSLLLLFLVGLPATPWLFAATTVVGDGTPASCTNTALGNALAGGGEISFNCGPNPHTILVNTHNINSNTVLDGGSLITLSGGGHNQRIFFVNQNIALTLRNITLADAYEVNGDGGAIFAWGNTNLTIENSTFRNNRTTLNYSGGAIVSYGAVTISNSRFENNRGGGGGAFYNRWTGASAVIENTVFENNRAESQVSGWGGAILTWDGSQITLRDSHLEGNKASHGGAIYNTFGNVGSVLIIERSTLVGNRANGHGGALYNEADLQLTDVEIRGNTSDDYGAGIANLGGSIAGDLLRILDNRLTDAEGNPHQVEVYGGGISNRAVYVNQAVARRGVINLTRTTFSGNTGSEGGAIFSNEDTDVELTGVTFANNSVTGAGGAIWFGGDQLSILNSTLSGNSAGASGGGIYNLGQNVSLANATLFANSAPAGSHLLRAGGAFSLNSTILAGPDGGGTNCGFEGAAEGINSAGYNLASDGSCGLAGTGDQQNANPLLGALADNGGPTLTHLLQPGSPAIDQGDNNACPETDQRGRERPAGDGCDIGAVEVDAPPDPPTATPTPTRPPTNTPTAVPTNTPTTVPTATPRPLNYVLSGLEVTQGIQDLQNTVPLVRSKRTWVRAYVYRTGGDSSPVITARLWRIVDGVRSGDPVYPSNPGGKIAPPTSTNRDQLNDSFYFRVPAAWSGASRMQLEVDINPVISPNCTGNPLFCPYRWWRDAFETSYTDNVLRTSNFFMQNVPPLRLKLYNVVYSKKTGNTTNWYQATDTQLFEIEDWLRRAYPIHSLLSQRSTTTMPESAIYTWTKDDAGSDVYVLDAAKVNQRLNLVRTINQIYNPDFRLQERYYGVVTNASGDTMRGLGGGFIASGPTGVITGTRWAWWDVDSSSFGDWYAGHEIGHVWNRGHPASGGFVDAANPGCDHSRDDPNYPYPNAVIGGPNRLVSLGSGLWWQLPPNRYYGFDIYLRQPVIYGPNWTDMMSYCDRQWISDYTYNAIRLQMASEGSVQAAATFGPAGNYALIQGTFAPDMASAVLDAILKIPSPAGEPLPDAGEFTLVFRGSGGQQLASYPFASTVYEDDERDPPLHYINLALPYPDGTQVIEVRKGDQLLATRSVSANAPVVQLLSPNGGEAIGPDGVTVNWTMNDADGDPLAATILFSTDNGVTWQTLAAQLTEAPFTVPYAQLSGTTQGRMRVLVSDGANTGHDDSDGVFTVENQAPEVAIVSPPANAHFVEGQIVLLSATAYDAEDGVLPDTAFTWRSDRDGELGKGSELEVTTLTPGAHAIELSVTDSAGRTTIQTRALVVESDLTNITAQLAVAPETIPLYAQIGANQTVTTTLAIRDANAGTGLTAPLAWSAAAPSVPWLSLSASSGVTPSDITLSANGTGLAGGVYTTTLKIAAGAVTREVMVELRVVTIEAEAEDGPLYLPLLHR